MAFLTAPESSRVADALESLLQLYTMDLTFRGVIRPESAEEGEVLETNDEDVALMLESLRSVKPHLTGAYIGDEEEKWEDGSPVIPEPLDDSQESLFGSGWGINVGPEGAEEDWSGPPSDGGTGESTPGDVRGQDSGEEPKG